MLITINLIEKASKRDGRHVMNRAEILCCPCDIRREYGRLIESECRNRTSVRLNEGLMKGLRSTMSHRKCPTQEEDGMNRCFGSWIVVEGERVTAEGARRGQPD